VIHYRKELILNITVFVLRVWGAIYRRADNQYYFVCCDGVRGAI
jgi:hypothetical protein